MKRKIVIIIIILIALYVLVLKNPLVDIFINSIFGKTIVIPYTGNIGQPNHKKISQTIDYLGKVKELRKIYIKEKLYLKGKYYTDFTKVFNKKILLKNKTSIEMLKINNDYKINEYYLHDVYISKNPKEYVLFLFNYSSKVQSGLSVHYGLFYDSRKNIQLTSKHSQIVVPLEDNWYFFAKTEVYEDSSIWNKVKSSRKDYIWDGTPPIEYIIKAYKHKKIEQWIRKIVEKT